MVEETRSGNTLTITVDLPKTVYADKMLRSKSFEELHHVFMSSASPIKEMSESYAAFKHVREANNQLDEHDLVVVIGDGGRPRTAATFAFNCKCKVISIDPMLNIEKTDEWIDRFNVQNLSYAADTWQNCMMDSISNTFITYGILRIHIVSVHGHIILDEVIDTLRNNSRLLTTVYTNPCCNYEQQVLSDPSKYSLREYKNFKDVNILSEKNQVIIYK